ncbi:MAG: serine/threonine protein kinase, partial [Nannocystaceae bacterium]|nr:serine/threonine protein kinase [Nannocystaceae bacterium]
MTSVEDNPTVTVAPPRGPPNPTLPRRVDAAVPLELQPPESVGRYDVGELLGHGGGGSVFVGHDHALDRDVAIKFVRFGGGSSESVRVLREARALARLSHPNIVNIYDYGRFDDTLYFVMELVAGPTLDQWHAEPRPWEQVLTLFIEIGRGLSAAHEANIVHRDFKPRNVIVAADGRPRILDFGLARLSRVREQARVGVIGDDDELTHDSVVQGTPKFMSPEQWSGGAVDGRTDQFSYCVCLFTALYGEPPYPRNAMLAASTGDSLPPLASAKSVDVPRTVRVALERGLRGDPADRWPSMDALLEVLTSSLRRRRRRVATYTSAAVIVGALSYAWTAGSEVACDSPRNDAPEFTDAQRDQMSAVFAATELPYARGTGEYVSRELRAFVSTWGEVAEEICLATARNELTKASRERRRACQVEQRLRFVATLDVLRETDAAALAGGAAAVASLPDPTECLAPIDDGVDVRVRDVVDRADLLRRAARLREALSVVDTALARDEALPDVLYVRARVHEQSGEYGLATTDLRQAYRLAESQGRDRIAAAAATALVRLLGYRTLRTDEASAFVVTAAAKLDRIVPQRHVMRAELAAAEGYLELGRGRPEGAVDAFRRAAEMRRAM